MKANQRILSGFLVALLGFVCAGCDHFQEKTAETRFEEWSFLNWTDGYTLRSQGGLLTSDGRLWAIAFSYSLDDLEPKIVEAGYEKVENFAHRDAWSKKISNGASIPIAVAEEWLVYRIAMVDGEKIFFVDHERQEAVFVENSW